MHCSETTAPLWCFHVSRFYCLQMRFVYRLGTGLTEVVFFFPFFFYAYRLRRNPESTEISVTRITSYVNIFQRSSSQRQGICGFLIYWDWALYWRLFFLNLKTNPSSFLLLWMKLKSAPEVQTLQFIASQEQFLCFCLTLLNVPVRGAFHFLIWTLFLLECGCICIIFTYYLSVNLKTGSRH